MVDEWLKGIKNPDGVTEPDVDTETVETLESLDLPADSPIQSGVNEMVRQWNYRGHIELYNEKFKFKLPDIKDNSALSSYQESLAASFWI